MHRARKHKKNAREKKGKCNQKNDPVVGTESAKDDVLSYTERDKTEVMGKEKLPYNIEISDIMGRYLVASHDLKPGELIISEQALVVGPCQGSQPICLGCYKKLSEEDGNYRCQKCGWPLCAPKCQGLNKDYGHSSAECTLLASANTKKHLSERLSNPTLAFFYNSIVPLRCLLLKSTAPEKWRIVLTMEAHNELRKNIPDLWTRNQEVVVDTIRQVWGMSQFKEDEIHTICGILEVNAFEIGQHNTSVRSLFPSAFLLCHDCIPNTSHTDDDNFCLTIRASTNISKGSPITLSYAYTLQGTMKRREHLKESKFFDCCCKRCSDPTELGTYCSALKCPKCTKGLVLSSAPLDANAPWNCTNKKCEGYSISAQSVLLLMDKINEEVEGIDINDVDGLESFLKRYCNVLHENHYLCLGVKHSLSQLYGKIDGYTINELPDSLLQRKKDICKEILRIFDVLEPGYSRLRGIILYELHAPIMVLATRRFEARSINKRDLANQLKEVVKCLEEASIILGFEPENSSEGMMGAASEDALLRMKDWQSIIGKLQR